MDHVGHDHVDQAFTAERSKIIATAQSLTRRKRDPSLPPDLPGLFDDLAFELSRFFNPERAEFLDPIAKLDGRERVCLPVNLNDDVKIWPDRLAHCG